MIPFFCCFGSILQTYGCGEKEYKTISAILHSTKNLVESQRGLGLSICSDLFTPTIES